MMLLSILLACSQGTPPAPAQSAPSEWKDLDGITFIVNEDIVTQRAFRNRLMQYAQARSKPIQTPEELRKARDEMQDEMVKQLVGSQAGETMGFDAGLVARTLRDYERRNIDAKGGVDQYAEYLAQNNKTAEETREEIRKYVYRDIWEDSKTGRGPSQQSRISADRFVRPGSIELSYRQLADQPRLVDLLGGTPSKVVLQVFEVDATKVGGLSQVEGIATKLRTRLMQGEDFATLAAGFATPGTRADAREALDEAGLAEVDPVLSRLVAAAKVGEWLPLVPPSGKVTSWRIVHLVERVPAVVPPFRSRELQRNLRTLIENRYDGIRLEQAFRPQFLGSYLWPLEK